MGLVSLISFSFHYLALLNIYSFETPFPHLFHYLIMDQRAATLLVQSDVLGKFLPKGTQIRKVFAGIPAVIQR